MPDIVIQGLRWNENQPEKNDYQDKRIESLENAMTKAILGIPELELTPDDISFYFPWDPSVTSEDIPIIIKIQLLFDKPKRTPKIRQLLTDRIEEAFSKTIRQWRKLTKIEVALDLPYKPQSGFCSKTYDK